jgi:hypothetical protein
MAMNAMAEYLTVGAGRRRAIIDDQKHPPVIPVTYYREALDAIARCLASGGADVSPLDSAIRDLRRAAPNKQEASRREAGREAISAFRAWLPDSGLDLRGLRRAPQTHPRRMIVGGVAISVRPELLIEDDDGHTVGCVKIYLKKEALSEERAKYTGTMLHQYVQDTLGAGPRADWRRCYVLDVVAGRSSNASKTYTRRRQEIAAACAEIAASWPTL